MKLGLRAWSVVGLLTALTFSLNGQGELISPETNAVNNLQAWEATFVSTNEVSNNGESPIFSPTEAKFAYIEPSGRNWPKKVIIKSLNEQTTERSVIIDDFGTRHPEGATPGLAWSPDGKRILCAEKFGRTAVIEVDSGKRIDLPEVSFSNVDVYWLNEFQVFSWWGDSMLDLNTLKFTTDRAISPRDLVQAAKSRSKHPHFAFTTVIEVNSGREIAWAPNGITSLTSKQREYTKVLPLGDASVCIPSPDSKYLFVVTRSYGREQRTGILLLSVGKSPAPSKLDFEVHLNTDGPRLIGVKTWSGFLGVKGVPLGLQRRCMKSKFARSPDHSQPRMGA